MMTQHLERVRSAHGEEGFALMLALIFLVLFGLVVAALLNWGFTAERTDSVVRARRDARYANDGAIEGAIKRFQTLAAGGTNPCPDAHFFTYNVNGKTATVACSGTSGGGTPNPPQALEATNVSGADFVAVNGIGGTATLLQTVKHLEATGFNGTIAATSYPHPNLNTLTFTYAGVSPPVGASYTQVLALVSHREGTGPGDAPSQDQSISVITGDTAGNLNVNCGTYTVVDAKATGGPNWPIPPYETVDISYQAGHAGDSGFLCLSTPARVQNAQVTYRADAVGCGGRTLANVTTNGTTTITSATGNFTQLGDVGQTVTITGIGTRTISSVTNSTTAVLNATVAAGTNRTLSIGSSCGSMTDLLDGVSICLCLWSRPTTATSTGCIWAAVQGNGSHTDCTNGNNGSLLYGNPAVKGGIFQTGDPTLVNNGSCTEICGSNTHSRYSSGEVGGAHALTITGWNFPAIGPVIYVSLRVVHKEQLYNLIPSVTISFPGSDCPNPITLPNQAGTYTQYQLILEPGCAPDTAAKMAGLTLTYTVTCTSAGGACGHSGVSSPYAYLDAITLDLDYQLGGPGGPAGATFVSTVPGTGASAQANATMNADNSVSVSGWQSSH